MPDFSVILQDPAIRELVQQNALERAFHDALFPRQMFRAEATPVQWPANVGDTMVFTGVGLMEPNMTPIRPGDDPVAQDYTKEQWTAQLNTYASAIDSHIPTSITAIASLFYRNVQQLGMSSAQALNRINRNRLYNAALAGWTVVDGAQTSTTSLRVKRLNGFTRARRPDLTTGSPVQFATVSTNNPLQVKLFDNSAEVSNTVVGFTPDTVGDEVGPGVLTMGTSVTSAADRAYIFSVDRSFLVRAGGGNKVDSLDGTDLLRLQDLRAAVGRLRQQNVPEKATGRFHAHLDPTSEGQIYNDPEWQRLLTSMPDSYFYKDYTIGEILGMILHRNTECPQTDTVKGGGTATFTQQDPFAGELYANGTTSGVQVHRVLVLGEEAIFEYYQDLSQLVTEAGVTGKVASSQVTNNGVTIDTDRIQLLIRSPQNRLQDVVSTAWKFTGDWPVRTDAATGDAARFKRVLTIEHGS